MDGFWGRVAVAELELEASGVLGPFLNADDIVCLFFFFFFLPAVVTDFDRRCWISNITRRSATPVRPFFLVRPSHVVGAPVIVQAERSQGHWPGAALESSPTPTSPHAPATPAILAKAGYTITPPFSPQVLPSWDSTSTLPVPPKPPAFSLDTPWLAFHLGFHTSSKRWTVSR